MPVYICRWQNGNVSAVSARSRDHAILLLDEFGNAEACELFPVKDSPLELQGFGGEMLDMLYDCVYPVYAKACTEAVGAWTEDGPMPPEKVEGVLRKLNDALSAERTRQWRSKEPQISDDSAAAHLQKVGHDIPKTVAGRVVKEHRHRKLLEMPPGSDKVN